MKTKNIKVQYSSRYQSGFAPKIQMEGRWLEKLGFPIGTYLVVEYEEGSIRIRPFTAKETAVRKEQELRSELARKQREYESLGKRLTEEYQMLSMVAEPQNSYDINSEAHPRRRK